MENEGEYPKYDNYDAINVNKTKEIPINYNKRISKSKLNTFKDGFKHILFILKFVKVLH